MRTGYEIREGSAELARRAADTRILYTSWERARAIRALFPGSRIVGYQRGYAIQLRVSGPYVTRGMVPC